MAVGSRVDVLAAAVYYNKIDFALAIASFPISNVMCVDSEAGQFSRAGERYNVLSTSIPNCIGNAP